MNDILKNIIRFILFIFVQQFILNEIPPLHQFITPYLYFLFILWLPFNINRISLMFVAFIFGITLDYLTHSPGLHAAPCVLIAYIRPYLISFLMPQDTNEQPYIEPSTKSMGFAQYSLYVTILTITHHFYLVFIEWLQFGNFLYFIAKVFATTGISLLLILLTEMLFFRNTRHRSTTA